MYELNRVIEFANKNLSENKKVIFATIVKTTGSSYRKKWTQMAISSNLDYAGHLSGGCVEKETLVQAQKVFDTSNNLIFEYDGSYRLGCKGIIWILLELVDKNHFLKLYNKIKDCQESRSIFKKGIDDLEDGLKQTYFHFNKTETPQYLNNSNTKISKTETIDVLPQRQLIVIGGEFDSDMIREMSLKLGYKTTQVVGLSYSIPKESSHIVYIEPEMIKQHFIFDHRTAILLMTHSYARDLHFIKELLPEDVAYIGTLGPKQRKTEIENYLFENYTSTNPKLVEKIENLKGPLGIDIPSKTPEGIAISIFAELIKVFNAQENLLLMSS